MGEAKSPGGESLDQAPAVPSSPGDWQPTASLESLRQRDRLMRLTRSFFYARDFFEVTTPTLSYDTVIDRHLDPFVVQPSGSNDDTKNDDKKDDARFLQTSPEFHMKRLLADGATAIFQLGPAFRVGESGPLHNPEFTMLEWYRCHDDMKAGMELLSELIDFTLGRGLARHVSYRSVFAEYVGTDPLTAELPILREAVGDGPSERFAGPEPMTLDRDGCLEWLFVDRVQPHLLEPTIVFDYPASQAALACIRQSQSEPPVAERFELFVSGVELANGYHELLDAAELARRNHCGNRLREADGKRSLPMDSRLLAAMQHGLPPCAGVALGFDRLAMIACGADSLDAVLSFPWRCA